MVSMMFQSCGPTLSIQDLIPWNWTKSSKWGFFLYLKPGDFRNKPWVFTWGIFMFDILCSTLLPSFHSNYMKGSNIKWLLQAEWKNSVDPGA